MDALGALRPNHEPRCTEYIPQMVTMTEKLIAEGHAYEAEGHVMFAVETYDRYGALAGRSLDDMLAGSRVEVAPYKKNPMDFVLWKPSTPEQPGWDSPWGRGRPGWHIECSAMAQALLGDVFDIHGGGIDLQFPHHENEVAQSCCANHTDMMANVWMHNGFLQVEGEKMAKSLGNFFTVKDLLDKGVPGEVMRFVLLSAHYRQPLDWTEKRVEEATATLRKWGDLTNSFDGQPEVAPSVVAALSDDLNTPLAISEMHALARRGERALLVGSAQLMGMLQKGMGVWRTGPERDPDLRKYVEDLIDARKSFRENKDFDAADAIRESLKATGIELADSGHVTEWSAYRFPLTKDTVEENFLEALKKQGLEEGIYALVLMRVL
jgi:cysteinyl-tRNA synthetase